MRFRIYPDGTVVNQEDFHVEDNATPYYDDYSEVEVPDLIVEHIENEALGK